MAYSNPDAFELDDIGNCYFAALIYGLRLISEKEEEMGLYPGSSFVDADALADFVSTKGDMLVKHLIMEEEKTKQRLIWTDAEVKKVAQEFRRLYPLADVITKRLPHGSLEAAQLALPSDRRREHFSFTVTNAIKLAIRGLSRPDSCVSRNKTEANIQPIKSDVNGSVPRPDRVADALSVNRIGLGIMELVAKALEDAASQIKKLSGLS